MRALASPAGGAAAPELRRSVMEPPDQFCVGGPQSQCVPGLLVSGEALEELRRLSRSVPASRVAQPERHHCLCETSRPMEMSQEEHEGRLAAISREVVGALKDLTG